MSTYKHIKNYINMDYSAKKRYRYILITLDKHTKSFILFNFLLSNARA